MYVLNVHRVLSVLSVRWLYFLYDLCTFVQTYKTHNLNGQWKGGIRLFCFIFIKFNVPDNFVKLGNINVASNQFKTDLDMIVHLLGTFHLIYVIFKIKYVKNYLTDAVKCSEITVCSTYKHTNEVNCNYGGGYEQNYFKPTCQIGLELRSTYLST